MPDMGVRQAGVAATALVLVALLAVVALNQPDTGAALAQAAGKEGKVHAKNAAAASIEGLQARVAKVMGAERKEGQLARTAMMRKEQKEVQLETAEDGLEASAENSSLDALALKNSHQSIQELKDAIAKDAKAADKAKAARKKLQKQLDKELNALAHQQFVAHKAAAKAKGVVPRAVSNAASKQGHKEGVAHAKTGSKHASMVKIVDGQESVLAGIDVQLLKLPKVRSALTQSLNANELKIASEVAKSMGAQFNISGIDDTIVAEAAVAAAEKDQDIPLEADAVTPAVSFISHIFWLDSRQA
jgi:hypothetical protein